MDLVVKYLVFVVELIEKANLPEWSKGVVLRTTKRKLAWVRTPQLAIVFNFISHYFILYYY